MKEGDGSLVCSNAAVGEERSPGLCDVVLNHGLGREGAAPDVAQIFCIIIALKSSTILQGDL